MKAKNQWPLYWDPDGLGAGSDPVRFGKDEGEEEKQWVENEFLGGSGAGRQQVGHLGVLLGDYEEAREAERIRDLRREKRAADRERAATIPEEDSDSNDDDGNDDEAADPPENEEGKARMREELKSAFERLIREKFIYGLLEVSYYL
jgi:hypothetical protein